MTWDGPFLVDGRSPDLDSAGRPETPPHLHNPAVRLEFGAERMQVAWRGDELVLDLVKGRRLAPAGIHRGG